MCKPYLHRLLLLGFVVEVVVVVVVVVVASLLVVDYHQAYQMESQETYSINFKYA